MSLIKKIGFIFTVLCLPFGWVQAEDKYVTIELITNQTEVVGGDSITVGLVQTITPHWHVYWINPGDSGEATEVHWSGIKGITTGEIQWPIPYKIPFGPMTNYGYEEQVVLLQSLELPTNLPDGPIELVADISLLVCEEICIPEFHQATLTLNDDSVPDIDLIQKAQNKLPIKQSWVTSYTTVDSDVILTSAYDASILSPAQASNIEVFYKRRGMVNNSAQAHSEHDDTSWIIKQDQGDLSASEIPSSDVLLVYQDPSGQRNGIQLFATYQAADIKNNDTSLFLAIGLALLGGMILNLMPCVFPVLALKAMSLVHMKNESVDQTKLHGWAYTFGILLSFLLIASVLMALKEAGAQIGWGFQLQNPLFVMFLIYLLVLVALNFVGLFEFGTGLTNVGSKLAGQQGLSGSFYTGILATLVATPCTAPFMGVAIGYALVQPFYVSLAVFLALGFGLALPYLLLAIFPITRSWLPQPGTWMIKFKEFLAFPMFATVAWLVWVLSIQAGSYGVLVSLMGLVFMVLGIWLTQIKGVFRWSGWVFMLLSLWPFYTLYQAKNQDQNTQNWQPFTSTSYAAAKNNTDPIFVNMTAAWCITCQVNEQVALNTEATRKLFSAEKIQYLKGDWTDFDADITQYLEKYQRNGVPIYVYYGPIDPLTGNRPEPQLLPQILTPAIVSNYAATELRE